MNGPQRDIPLKYEATRPYIPYEHTWKYNPRHHDDYQGLNSIEQSHRGSRKSSERRDSWPRTQEMSRRPQDRPTRRHNQSSNSDRRNSVHRSNSERGTIISPRTRRTHSPSHRISSSHHSQSTSVRHRRNNLDDHGVTADDSIRPPERYSIAKMLKSAALGGGLEAIRARNEPGPWTGQKGQRIALAAGAGVVVGSLRNGRLQSSGKLPYAEALATGFFAVEWWKKIARHTEHQKKAQEELKIWKEEAEKHKRRRQGSEGRRGRTRGNSM